MEQREKTSSNRMQLLREEKGLNMKEAAAQLQLPYTTYRNYEQGLREPNSETLVQKIKSPQRGSTRRGYAKRGPSACPQSIRQGHRALKAL